MMLCRVMGSGVLSITVFSDISNWLLNTQVFRYIVYITRSSNFDAILPDTP
ncbi:hypothetical protein ccbrp13_07840 [Ktedonobacteria bacterium brp13]|nr:hypothetical protein ccbrp13_07840 [Ktedonobacteria bacterium brp13]